MITLILQDEINHTNVACKTTMVNFYDENFIVSSTENIVGIGGFNEQVAGLIKNTESKLSQFIYLAVQLNLTLSGVKQDNQLLYVKNGKIVGELQINSIVPVQTGVLVLQNEEHFTALHTGNYITLSKHPVSNYHIQVYRNGKLQLPVYEYVINGFTITFIRPFGYGQNQRDADESISVYYTTSIVL